MTRYSYSYEYCTVQYGTRRTHLPTSTVPVPTYLTHISTNRATNQPTFLPTYLPTFCIMSAQQNIHGIPS